MPDVFSTPTNIYLWLQPCHACEWSTKPWAESAALCEFLCASLLSTSPCKSSKVPRNKSGLHLPPE